MYVRGTTIITFLNNEKNIAWCFNPKDLNVTWPVCWKVININVEKYRLKAGMASARIVLSLLNMPIIAAGNTLMMVHTINEYIMSMNTRIMNRPLVVEEERLNFNGINPHGIDNHY